LLLLSSSVKELQLMLDSCSTIGNDLDIKFNSSKSMCMVIGRCIATPATMYIDKLPIPWVDEIKYLGIHVLKANKFTVNFDATRRKFFAAVNSIYSRCKHCSDMVQLSLLETFCLPILLYVIESLDVSDSQMREINSWWNSVYRKVFNYNKWESVKEIIFLCGRLNVPHLVNLRTILFVKNSCIGCNNQTFMNLLKYYTRGAEFCSVQDSYQINVSWPFSKIKSAIYSSFKLYVNVA